MNINYLLLVFVFIFATVGRAQISGCTDPLSKNFNKNASQNDGSCLYERTVLRPTSHKIDEKIQESSGLIFWNGKLWTHNDNGDTILYGLEKSSGGIVDTISLKGIRNQDWEEIAQDSAFIYIGDFGNNLHGNRTDLHFLRVEKKGLLEGNQKIDTIAFHYSNQDDFTKIKPNRTNFDGEAFIVTKDSIFIFTKEWKSGNTSLYSLPNHPGSHIAKLKSSFKVKGLITGAIFLEEKNMIILCGYSKKLRPFLYLLYGYNKTDFFSGNKRKIKLKPPFRQIEGIATENGKQFYLTNERFVLKPFVKVEQQLHLVDLSTFLAN